MIRHSLWLVTSCYIYIGFCILCTKNLDKIIYPLRIVFIEDTITGLCLDRALVSLGYNIVLWHGISHDKCLHKWICPLLFTLYYLCTICRAAWLNFLWWTLMSHKLWSLNSFEQQNVHSCYILHDMGFLYHHRVILKNYFYPFRWMFVNHLFLLADHTNT